MRHQKNQHYISWYPYPGQLEHSSHRVFDGQPKSIQFSLWILINIYRISYNTFLSERYRIPLAIFVATFSKSLEHKLSVGGWFRVPGEIWYSPWCPREARRKPSKSPWHIYSITIYIGPEFKSTTGMLETFEYFLGKLGNQYYWPIHAYESGYSEKRVGHSIA